MKQDTRLILSENILNDQTNNHIGTGSAEQEGYIRDTIVHASAAESRDGDGGGDDPEELGAELGGVEASTRRRELPGNGNNTPFIHMVLHPKQNFTAHPASRLRQGQHLRQDAQSHFQVHVEP